MTTIVNNIVKNSHTRVWLFFDRPDQMIKRIYASTLMVWRIMIDEESKIARVILRGRLHRNANFNLVQDFEQGGRIECHYGNCGDPSKYNPMAMVAFFHECIRRRSWVEPLGAFEYKDVGTVDQWLEVESKSWRLEF